MLIHIGLPKTGSTWLQTYVIENAELGFRRSEAGMMLKQEIIHRHAFEFNADEVRKSYDLLSRDDKKDTLAWLSYERLAGNANSGGYDTKEIADRLKSVFPDSKILIIIREQKDMILSHYKQSIKAGATAPIEAYIKTPNPHTSATIPRFNLNYFSYHRIIEYYYNLFGKEKVLVLPYELFRRNPKSFVRHIVTFSGLPEPEDDTLNRLPFDVKPRKARGSIETYLKRYISGFFAPRNEVNPNALFPSEFMSKSLTLLVRKFEEYAVPDSVQIRMKKNLKNRIAKIVQDYYQLSNQKVENLTGLDLREYGYDLP